MFLKYTKGRRPVIQGLKRISKPGLRNYVGHQEIPRFLWEYGSFDCLHFARGVCREEKQSNRRNWRRTSVFGLVRERRKRQCLVKVNFRFPFQKE